MNIFPVSFGRAIKLNTKDKQVAQRITEVANMANYEISKPVTREGKALQKFIETIFNDTHLSNGRARVIYGTNGDLYIFSGKEGAKAIEISEDTKNKIRENNEFVESLPDRYCRENQRRHYAVINQQYLAERNRHILSLVEDGNRGQKSSLDIECSEIKDKDKTTRTIIDKITYTTSSPLTEETKVFDRTNI